MSVAKEVITVIDAFAGLVLIVFSSLNLGDTNFYGLAFAIASGVFYAFFVIVNRKAPKTLTNTSVTAVQMATATVVILPFVLFGDAFTTLGGMDTRALIMLLILGVVHTGIAYLFYFPVYKKLPALTISVLSYLEPFSSMAFAAVLLGEALTVYHVAGGVLVLGSTLFCVVYESRQAARSFA